MFHETGLPGSRSRGRIIFGWRRTASRCVPHASGKEGRGRQCRLRDGSLGSSLDLHSSPWERRLQDCDVDSGEQLCGEH